MRVEDAVVKDYLGGRPLEPYRDFWFFQGENPPLSAPEGTPDEREKTARVLAVVREELKRFRPVNQAAWEALFPHWREQTGRVTVALIAGYPEPYDAISAKNPEGAPYIILDMVRWTQYLGKVDLASVARNLLTHELTHALIRADCPEADRALEGCYRERLDGIAFHEGFAHLISYQGKEIGQVDWDDSALAEVDEKSRRELARALACQAPAEREDYLRRAQQGGYYEKFACMAGMLYLARRCFLKEEGAEPAGIPELAAAFREGPGGFAQKCARTGPV